MFHFAEPEEAGLGVMILTPGLTRSSQVSMFFGLPLRTTITTTDWVRMPLVGVDFQSSATSFSSTSFCTSGSSERWTMSASWPPMTARAWSPDAPYDCLKVDVLAVGGLVPVGDDLLVGLLEDGEADQVDGRPSCRTLSCPPHAGQGQQRRSDGAGDRGLPLVFMV